VPNTISEYSVDGDQHRLQFQQDAIAQSSLAQQIPLFKNHGFLLQPKERHMGELYDWLSRQHHGLRTFQLFREKLAELSEGEPDKRALYALLGRLAARYIEAFDEQPVPATVADRAYDRLLELLASLDQCASAAGQLDELNRIAALDLVTPRASVDRYNAYPEPTSG
jgi:hypothetical protein